MNDKRDLNLQSTKRQKRILPEDSFGDWKWREGLVDDSAKVGSAYLHGRVLVGHLDGCPSAQGR